MYKIILNNGDVLEKLELNGNNYISDKIIESSTFENNLDNVIVEDGEGNAIEYKNMKLIQNIIVDGKSWFILAEKSKEDLLLERMSELEELALILGGVI